MWINDGTKLMMHFFGIPSPRRSGAYTGGFYMQNDPVRILCGNASQDGLYARDCKGFICIGAWGESVGKNLSLLFTGYKYNHYLNL